MAKRRQQQKRSSQGRSGGQGGFSRGLAIGLAVAAMVQLYHAGLPDWFGGESDESAGASNRESPSTNLTFYRLLPKAEVRVDEPEPPADAPAAASGTADPPPSDSQPGPAAPTGPPAAPGFQVQVGSFRVWKKADELRASLSLGGFESAIHTTNTPTGTWHRVQLGPFRAREAAEAAKARVLTARGIDARIVREGS